MSNTVIDWHEKRIFSVSQTSYFILHGRKNRTFWKILVENLHQQVTASIKRRFNGQSNGKLSVFIRSEWMLKSKPRSFLWRRLSSRVLRACHSISSAWTPFVYKSSFSITAYEGHKKSLDPYQKWTSSLFFSKLIRTVNTGPLWAVGFESAEGLFSQCEKKSSEQIYKILNAPSIRCHLCSHIDSECKLHSLVCGWEGNFETVK